VRKSYFFIVREPHPTDDTILVSIIETHSLDHRSKVLAGLWQGPYSTREEAQRELYKRNGTQR
jgi:hypothetical protein